MKYRSDCINCNHQPLHEEVIKFSNTQYGVTLCRKCQAQYRNGLIKSANNANRLFFALKAINIEATLSHNDGIKTIDIYIEKARLYIEVDGEQHNINAEQALTDLKRTYYAIQQGYITLRIPNSLVKKQLKEAVNLIVHIVDILKDRKIDTMEKIA